MSILHDLRYGLRNLLKNPGFTLISVITLALGIGANTSIFSVGNAVLLRPLPYPESDQLTWVWMDNRRDGIPEDITSWPNFVDWRDQNRVFQGMAVVFDQKFNLTGAGEPEELRGASVSAKFFELMRSEPLQGRGFSADEEQEGRNIVVVIGYDLWQRRFGGDRNIIGQSLSLDGQKHNIVGVMPPGFQFPDKTELWKPLVADAQMKENRGNFCLPVIGRLKPGVTLEQAQTEMDDIARRLERQYPTSNADCGVRIVSMRRQSVGKIWPALLMLFVAVACVLLIACANVANLLLARGTARRKEIAIRVALGAGRWRIVRQLLTESLVLAGLGGALGLLLASCAMSGLRALGPRDLPRAEMIGVDARVLLFTLALSLVTAMLFGVSPALQASKVELSESLNDGGRGGAGGRGGRTRAVLVIIEIALALLLLLGAALLLKSSWLLRQVNPGFNIERALKARLSLPPLRYREGADVAGFYERLIERLGSTPGVQAAGAISNVLMRKAHYSIGINIEGAPAPNGLPLILPVDSVSPGYFQTMQMQIVRGRAFTAQDQRDGTPVAVINETMAQRFWPNEDPVGKRFTFEYPRPRARLLTVVGVVRDSKRQGLDAEVRIECFLPHSQWPTPDMEIVVRTTGDPLAMARAVRETVWSLDRELPVSEVETIRQMLSERVAPRRFNLLLLSLFAIVALLLAATGIYGVMAYSVTQRTSEIGIRLALGAQKRDILKLVIWSGMRLALIGLSAGLLGALALMRLMASLLFGVTATDPLTFITITLLLTAVAFLACWLPARRATKVDPIIAIRASSI